MSIRWPKEWPQGDGWISDRDLAPTVSNEPRQWRSLDNLLATNCDCRISERVSALGGPDPKNTSRTIQSVTYEVQVFYREFGRRPSNKTDSSWNNHDQFLKRQGSSLKTLCDDLGLPERLKLNRTMDTLQTEIAEFFAVTGDRPHQRTNREWGLWDKWLRHNHATSLAKVCDEAIPSTKSEWFSKSRRDRRIAAIRRSAQQYFERTGCRPTSHSSKGWEKAAAWLSTTGRTSLMAVCDDLNLPRLTKEPLTRRVGPPETGTTDIEAQVRAFYKVKGRRPYESDGREWQNRANRLRRQGSSLASLCKDLGLPGGPQFDRTLGSVRNEIQAWFEKTGRRPSANCDRTWQAADRWLRKRGSSVSALSDELGLPGLNLNRTMTGIKKELRAFFSVHGRPPRYTEGPWQGHYQWLRKQGTSLKKLIARVIP